MATTGDGNPPYETAGAGGKFRKRPLRRSIPATPYARPPSAARNHKRTYRQNCLARHERFLGGGGGRRDFNCIGDKKQIDLIGFPTKLLATSAGSTTNPEKSAILIKEDLAMKKIDK
ncbi:hypothetical protein HanXRQr2_Chr07g0311531 [Helianthus annuus]|uniref:Uncharacterized protein n=1 Tax=Helianthus annuus TaxID=4232 RepID=A0A251UD25_HELAN|nr:hypothetical protein HanXRQr2_Chr07g0311531 [Helianthus annuus]